MGGNFSIEEKDSDKDVTRKLQIRQTAVTTLFVIQLIGLLYMLTQTLVTGYCIVDAGTGGTALPHAIWLIATAVIVFVGPLTTRFEVGLYVDTITYGIYYLYVMLVIAIVANAVSLGFFIYEMTQGISNFYVQSFGFLIATIVVTSLFILLQLITIVAARIFHRDFCRALEMGWVPTYESNNPLYLKKKEPPQEPPKDEIVPDEKVPLLSKAQIRRKLIQ